MDSEELINACLAVDSTDKLSDLLKDVPVNVVDANNWQPIHHAAQKGVLGAVSILLNSGGFVDAPLPDNRTPLHLAASEGNLDIVRYLLENGANVNVIDEHRETPLHKAVLQGHQDVATILMDAHINIDAVSKTGCTALHHAARLGHVSLVKSLIENGADFVICAKDSRSALDMATDGKFASAAYILTIIATKTLRAIAALSAKLDQIVSVNSETASRSLDESGGVLQTPSGAQLWLAQGALRSPHSFKLSLHHQTTGATFPEQISKDSAHGPVLVIDTDNVAPSAVCRLPTAGSGVEVWSKDQEVWQQVKAERCVVTSRFVDVTLDSLPQSLVTVSKAFAVTVLVFAAPWTGDIVEIRKNGIRLVVFVIPDREAVREAVVMKVRERHPELCLAGERFFPMSLKVGSSVSVSTPKHQPLKRTYQNSPLGFENKAYSKECTVRVETESGFVDVMVQLIVPPPKPHTPVVDTVFSESTTVQVPTSPSPHGGFQETTHLEIRYLPIAKGSGDEPILPLSSLLETAEWRIEALPAGTRSAQLPFNYAAYVEARAVSDRDSSLTSSWSRTLLVKPRTGGTEAEREVETDISPTSSFHDGETPNMKHGRFSFDCAPPLEDPVLWADRCASAASCTKVNRKGSILLTRRAYSVARACLLLQPIKTVTGRVDDAKRKRNSFAGKVLSALRNAYELLVQCAGCGWLGKIIDLKDHAEEFSNADRALVDAAVEYGVCGSAIGGLHSYSHETKESAFSGILFEYGLARMHLASVLFPHLESWATLEECVSAETSNIALDFDASHSDLAAEVNSEIFRAAVTITRPPNSSTGLTSFTTRLCQVFVSGVVAETDSDNSCLLRLLQRELSHLGFKTLSSANAVALATADVDHWREEAIKNCKAMVVMATSEGEHSAWNKLELKLAHKYRKSVLYLLHSGVVTATGGLPLLFRSHHDLLLSLKKIKSFLVSAGVVHLMGDSLTASLRIHQATDPVKLALDADDDSVSLSSRRGSLVVKTPGPERVMSELSMKESPRETLEAWLAKCNLKHIAPLLRELGAYEPSDLQDLDDDDIKGLALKPLEVKRFKRVCEEYFSGLKKRNSSTSNCSSATGIITLESEVSIKEDSKPSSSRKVELATGLPNIEKGNALTPRLKSGSRGSSQHNTPRKPTSARGLNRQNSNNKHSVSLDSRKMGRHKTVASLRPRAPVVVSVDATVLDVCKAMRAKASDSAVLVRGHWVAGIVTCTDITRKVAATGLSTCEPIVKVMTPNPKCVTMDDDATEALIMMMDNHFRHLPVLDRGDNIIALLDIGRCIADAIGKIDRMQAEQQEALSDAVALASSTLSSSLLSGSNQERIQKVLGPLVDTMFRKLDLRSIIDSRDNLSNEVATINSLVRHTVKKMAITARGVAVIDDNGALVGIFTPRDLNNRVLSKNRNMDATTMKEVMTDDPEFAEPSLTLLDALYRMHDSEVLQLTVVDPEQGVLGMVNVFDVLLATMGTEDGERGGNTEGWRSFFSSAFISDAQTPNPTSKLSIFPTISRSPSTPSSSRTPPRNSFHQDSVDCQSRMSMDSQHRNLSVTAAAAAAMAEVASAYEEATAVQDVARGNWKCGKPIGAGSFGHVFQGMNTLTGELIAVKFLRAPNTFSQNVTEVLKLKPIDMSSVEALAAADIAGKGGVAAPSGTDVNSDVGVKKIRSEVELMEGLRHPNIVRYLGAELYTDSVEHRLYILQEWVPGGSLEHLVKSYGVLNSEVTSRYLRDILDGLVFLHDNDTVHRDLKPGNVLVSDKGIAKLCDFGASRRLGHPDTGSDDEHTVEGSPYYMAPEQMRGEEGSDSGRKADVWSVGGLVLFLVTGEHPWQCLKPRNVMALFAAVQSKNSKGPPMDSYQIDPVVKSFMQLCLQNDKDLRPSAEDLLSDPLLFLSESKRRLSATPRGSTTPRSSFTPRGSLTPSSSSKRNSSDSYEVNVVTMAASHAARTPRSRKSEDSLPAIIRNVDSNVIGPSEKLVSLFPSLDGDEANEPKKKARGRWGKVRNVISETPEKLLVAKQTPQVQHDMNEFAIMREDLMLAKRPFAVGGGGQIYKGTYNGSAVAAKAIFSQMNDVSGATSHVEFHQEFSMLASLHHPNIVTFYGISEDAEHGTLYIVEEFCPGGDLASYIVKQTESLSDDEYCRLATELFGAVRYMHDKGIAHRDLKPQNVLLTEHGRVKICDLGQARSFRKVAVTAAVGTAAYMPPEAFDEAITSDPTYAASHWDTFSLGVMLWQLWYREEPWGGKSTHKIYASLMKGKRPPFTDPMPPDALVEIITQMWHQDHKKRPTLREAIRMFDGCAAAYKKHSQDVLNKSETSQTSLPFLAKVPPILQSAESSITPRSPHFNRHFNGSFAEDSEL